MKQLDKDVLCYYCLGCNKEELENFNGVKNCKTFIVGRNTKEFYEKLKEGKTNGKQT